MIFGSDEKGPERMGGPIEISVLETEQKTGLEFLTAEERKVFFQVVREADLDINQAKWESWEDMFNREMAISGERGGALPNMPELMFHKIINLSILEGQNHIIPIVGPIDPARKPPSGHSVLKFTTTTHINVETIDQREDAAWGLALGPGDEVTAYGFRWFGPGQLGAEDLYDRGIIGTVEPGEGAEFRGPTQVPGTVMFVGDVMARLPEYFRALYTYFWHVSNPDVFGGGLLGAAKIAAVWDYVVKGAPAIGWGTVATETYGRALIASAPTNYPDVGIRASGDLILQKIGDLFGRKFVEGAPGLVTSDLYNIGQLGLYHLAQEKGLDSLPAFKALEQAKIWAGILREIRTRGIYNKYEEQIILGFIEKKLGSARYAEIVRALRAKPYLMGPKIVEVLRENEKKLIQIERNHYMKQIEAATANKCPHRPLSFKLHTSLLMADLDKVFGQITTFMSPGDVGKLRAFIDSVRTAAPEEGAESGGKAKRLAAPMTAEIPCTTCGFDLICPHLAISVMMRRAPFGQQRAAMGPYIDEPVGDNYFCNVCGELISTTEAFGQITTDQAAETLSNIDDAAYETISSEIVPIVRLITATELLPFGKLMKNIIVMIYPYVFEIEKQLGKIQTDKDEHDNRYKLFISIYALAAVIHLIISNNAGASGRSSPIYLSMKGISGPDSLVSRPGAARAAEDTVALLKFGLARLTDFKNVVINRLHNITPEFIKNKLIEAYKTISAAGSMSVNESPKENEMFNMIMTDPVYHYLFSYYGARLSGKKRPDMVVLLPELLGQNIMDIAKRVKARTAELKKKASGGKRTIVHAVGMSPADTAGEDVYEKIKVPKITDAARKFLEIKPFSAKTGQFGAQYTGPGRAASWTGIYAGYSDACAHAFFEWVVARKWDAFMDALDLGPLMPEIIEAERRLDVYWKMSTFKNIYAQRPKSTRTFVARDIKLGRIYDETGKPHQWSIYIVEGGGPEVTRADIIKMIEIDKKRHNFKIIDKKCSGCGALLSASEGLDEAKIRAALSHSTNVTNVLVFFENRCPVDENTHSMVGGACSKCGYQRDMDGPAREAYFTKYSGKYAQMRAAPAAQTVTNPVPQAQAPESGPTTFAREWVANSGTSIALCHDLSININAFNALGATERKQYSDIIAGKEIPPEADILSTRAAIIDNYLNGLIIAYNQLKYVDMYLPGKEPQFIIDLMNETRAGRKQLKELPGPDSNQFSLYQARLRAMRLVRSPPEIIVFMIEELASVCAQIYKKGGDLGKTFITKQLGSIMLRDELRSKPGSFNWNVFKAEDAAFEAQEYDPNFDPDAGIETKDALQDENLGTTDKPMQSNFDLDLEPGQEEEEFLEDNQLGVEGYAD